MLIDPQGLLHGDRLRCCSDEAQLHFPRLLAASNSFGRFKMSMEWLSNEVYDGFQAKPTREQMTAWMREYHDNFLLFVYRAPDGSTWAQWDIPEKLLGRYRYEADKKTPAPPEREHAAYRAAYIEKIRLQNETRRHSDDLAHGFVSLPKSSETLRKVAESSETLHKVSSDVLVGVGVGVLVGVNEKTAPAPPAPKPAKTKSEPHPLHAECKKALFDFYLARGGNEPAWSAGDNAQLAELLKSLPDITLERFKKMLFHRNTSDVNHSERPRRFLASLPDYELGPLDRYGKPKSIAGFSGARVGMQSVAPSAEQTKKLLAKQDDDAVNYWREMRARASPRYAAECPNWIRQRLENETVEAVA